MEIQFSIIIPTYNRSAFLKAAIDSVLSQTNQEFEVIVVNDGSSDDTKEVVQTCNDHRIIYEYQQNRERGAARNKGIQLATGKYITFLDSDDLFYPDHLATALEFLQKNNNPEVFHLAYQIVNPAGKVLKKIDHLSEINKAIIYGNPLSCMGVFVRTDVMTQNLFNEDRDLSGLEDWELWLRMGTRYRFINCRKITGAITQHPARSVSQDAAPKLELKIKKFLEYIFHDEENKRVYGRKLQYTAASANTYTALHLAMLKSPRPLILSYLKAGIAASPFELFRKRFLVILYLIIFR